MKTYIVCCGSSLEQTQISGGKQKRCDLSLEPSQRDGSNEGSQHMFSWRNVANYP